MQLINESVFSQNHYPFYLIVGTKPKLKLNFFYNKDLYEEQLILDICDQFLYLIEQSIENDQLTVDALKLIRPESSNYKQLKEVYNQTSDTSFQLDTSVKAVFEQIAETFPDQPALHSSYSKFTYKELNEMSNRFGHYIQERLDFNEGTPAVGILVNRADLAVTAMLGAIKAGAMFVPIHPDLPVARISAILAEANVQFLCLESSMLGRLGPFQKEMFAMDFQLDMLEDQATSPSNTITSQDPLYTIFSSGTTGTPKGIVISHRSLLNYAQWFKSHFQFEESNRGALLSSYAFDLGYTTLWGCLLSGATLYLPEKTTTIEPNKLVDYLLREEISFLKLTPSHFKLLLAASNRNDLKESKLQRILLGGEKIIPSDIQELVGIKSDIQVVNHYGPTEATIGVITHTIDEATLNSYTQFPFIGTPISNARAYILDQDGTLLPIGAQGDLYLGGEGLAIHYLNQPDLTNKKFIQSAWGERLYKTGDKAQRFPNGEILFLGRADQEVKVRGYRVDMQEIEYELNNHPEVSFSSVQANYSKSGIVKLVAYVQYQNGHTTSEVISFLKSKLPEYMVPEEFIEIEEVPLTANGKLDINQLKKLVQTKAAKDIIPPANETEEQLLKIWKEVLGKAQISMDDDFFDLGGHSLKAVQIISRIIVVFQVTLEVKDIFDFTTLRQLAKVIESKKDLQEHNNASLDEITI